MNIGERLFNHACSQAAAKYCNAYLDDCMMGGYDPFNDDEQLTWIFDLVVHYSNAPMDIDGGADSEGNFTGNYMREYVHENINVLLEDDKEQFRETDEELQKIQQFNAFCAKTMGWYQGTGRVEDYNPYDDIEQMTPVLDILSETRGLFITAQDALNNGPLQAGRGAISNFILPEDTLDGGEGWKRYTEQISKTVPEALNNLAAAVDAFHIPIHGTNIHTDYPDIKGEHEKFNEQCRTIIFRHAANHSNGAVLLSKNYDPYYNGAELLNILEIVLQYLPDSIQLLFAGEKDKGTFDDVTWHIQQFIRSYGTNEWMLNEEEQFNEMCKILVDGYNIFDCHVNADFDPYNKIEHLAPILPIVARRVNEDFTLGALMYDLPREESYNMDLFDNMRHYVQRHGPAVVEILEND